MTFTPNLSGVTASDFADAINDATAWLVSTQGGGTCCIPAGRWGVTAPILLRPSVEICGEWVATRVEPVPGYDGAVFENEALASGFTRWLALRDLRIAGATREAIGVRLSNAAETFLDRVIVDGCAVGIDADSSIVTNVARSKINDNGRGVVIRNGSNGFAITAGTRVQASRGANISVDGPNTYNFSAVGCLIESSGIDTEASGIALGQQDPGVKGAWIAGNHIESNRCGEQGQVAVHGTGGAIVGNWITAGSGAYSKRAIVVTSSAGVTISGNDTAAHEHTVWLDVGANGVHVSHGRNDDAAHHGGAGIPYFEADNGSLSLKGDIAFTAPGTQRISKAQGNMAVEATTGTVFVNGSAF